MSEYVYVPCGNHAMPNYKDSTSLILILVSPSDTQKYARMVYNHSMRTNIDIDESLVRQARKLTRLKTKRQIVDKALELLVRSESRKGILRYYGSGNWKGDPKAMRRNRV